MDSKHSANHLLNRYEAEHRHPVNRALHAVGIPLVLVSVAALASPWWPFDWSRKWAAVPLVGGWVLLFAGHAVEGNRPLILKNPAAALIGAMLWMRAWLRRVAR